VGKGTGNRLSVLYFRFSAAPLVLIDLGAGRQRMGGSMLAQVMNQFGLEVPDVDDPEPSTKPCLMKNSVP
jgi:phosphoribosylformylglycinamidine (FGAM) synthase-like enzyme